MVGDAVKCCGCRCSSVTCDRRLHSVHNARALPVHLQSVHGTLLQSSALQRLDLCAGQQRRRRAGLADGRLDCTGVCSAGGAAMPRLRPAAEKSRLASRVQKAHSVHSGWSCWNCTTGSQAQCIALEALCDRLLL